MARVLRRWIALCGVFPAGVVRAASLDSVSKLIFGIGCHHDYMDWLETLLLIGLSCLVYALFIVVLGRCLPVKEIQRDE